MSDDSKCGCGFLHAGFCDDDEEQECSECPDEELHANIQDGNIEAVEDAIADAMST